MKHLEWPRHPYKVMPPHIWVWAWTRNMPMEWRVTRAVSFLRAAAAALKETGDE